MDTIQTTSSSSLPAAATAAAPKKEGINSDFDTFLRMLTVQMQNQDPLDPVDSADYATQLATFSGVEQQVQTNDLLRQMAGQLAAGGLSELAGWVGKEARTEAAVAFDGTPLTLLPSPARGATSAQLIVKDAAGATVQTISIETGGDPVVWSGQTEAGQTLPHGTYSFETRSISAGEVIAETPSSTYATVSEVQIKDGETFVVLASGQALSASAISAIRDPSLRTS
ncbi:hypothetical protein EU805_13035 [Salipiger sp. IMCC34102]|uniref:flagellar hook capping FlgD N-terminal domain-containing protein n=1 Tax=Salipiger sp. IMCC34102 TaxID=2510647 RepID=UPI00101E0B35|nr:flagellar hook capping FlgD N-terminal domain-containing protein [Salipiger sp. IMCC34102]RYH01581.1 hypothetical protein EU805_13035 [Salipiger sp. IMCC34102]